MMNVFIDIGLNRLCIKIVFDFLLLSLLLFLSYYGGDDPVINSCVS